jgi:hypothetical protein
MNDKPDIDNEADLTKPDNLLNQINLQLSFLKDKFKVYDNIDEFHKEKSVDTQSNSHFTNKSFQNLISNSHNDDFLVKENSTLRDKLKEKENLLNNMKYEFKSSENYLKNEIKAKDLMIDSLRKELDYLKNEKINFERGKFAQFNPRMRKLNSHQDSMMSISSLSTFHEDGNTRDKIIDSLTTEKICLEKQLLDTKCKLADTEFQFSELESAYLKTKKNSEVTIYQLLIRFFKKKEYLKIS